MPSDAFFLAAFVSLVDDTTGGRLRVYVIMKIPQSLLSSFHSSRFKSRSPSSLGCIGIKIILRAILVSVTELNGYSAVA